MEVVVEQATKVMALVYNRDKVLKSGTRGFKLCFQSKDSKPVFSSVFTISRASGGFTRRVLGLVNVSILPHSVLKRQAFLSSNMCEGERELGLKIEVSTHASADLLGGRQKAHN